MSGFRCMCVRVLGVAFALFLLAPVGSAFAQEESPVVDMHGLQFVPAAIHIQPGTTVTWTNSDPLAHTVTADDASFDSGSIDPGAVFQMEFDTPGTFQYYCQPHGSAGLHGMAATIIVDDPNAFDGAAE